MKKLIFAVIAMSVIACSTEKNNYAVISGKINNHNEKFINLMDSREVFKQIPVKDDGTFSDTIRNYNNKRYFALSIDNSFLQVFIQDGTNLKLEIPQKIADAKVTGTDSELVNYLREKEKKFSEDFAYKVSELYTLTPKEFKSKVEKVMSDLEAITKKYNLSSEFLETEKKWRLYGTRYILDLYPSSYESMTGSSIEIPQDFLKNNPDFDINNVVDYEKFEFYQQMVQKKVSEPIQQELNNDNIKKVISTLENSKNDLLKEDLSGLIVSFISPKSKEITDLAYNFVEKNIKDPQAKKEVEIMYSLVQKMYPGMPAPEFSFENSNGSTTSLSSLKGKLIYIDIWATWCVPCIQEIPSLKSLMASYKDKDINFVGISIDDPKNKSKWNELIKKEDLSNLQLFSATGDIKKFSQDYIITTIPRFILIDKNGIIIDSEAPRPSDPNLHALLDKNLN